MTRLNNPSRRNAPALFAGAHLAARAQNVQPFVDCVELERDANGATTGNYIAYFGYINYGTTTAFIPVNSAANFLTPVRSPAGQPDTFLPGVYPRALAVVLSSTSIAETWRLTNYILTASFTNGTLCGSDGANSRLTTYQGRLNDGAAAASECDSSSEYGRQKVDANSLRLYICTAAGWKSTALQ